MAAPLRIRRDFHQTLARAKALNPLVSLGFLVALFCGGIASAEVEDQRFTGPIVAPAVTSMTSIWERTQTFTVGVSGTLTRVELALAPGSNTQPSDEITVDVRPTDIDGIPLVDNLSILGYVTVQANALSTLTHGVNYDVNSFDLSGDSIQVTSGEVLAIVVSTATPTDPDRGFQFFSDAAGSYTGGQSYRRSGPTSSWIAESTFDWGFVTYVPEPQYTSVAALTTLGAVSWFRRRTARTL